MVNKEKDSDSADGQNHQPEQTAVESFRQRGRLGQKEKQSKKQRDCE